MALFCVVEDSVLASPPSLVGLVSSCQEWMLPFAAPFNDSTFVGAAPLRATLDASFAGIIPKTCGSVCVCNTVTMTLARQQRVDPPSASLDCHNNTQKRVRILLMYACVIVLVECAMPCHDVLKRRSIFFIRMAKYYYYYGARVNVEIQCFHDCHLL